VARSGFLDFADGKSQDKFLQFGTPRSGSDFLDFSDAATGVEQDISRRRTFADSAIDFVVDQLDPLNLALLAASFGGAGLAARIAKPLISTTAGAILTRTSAAAGTQVAEAVAPSLFSRIAHRALIGTGGIIPFAAAELIEEPEPGTTRIGNFSRSLLTMELIDAAFIAAGGTLFGGFARGAKRAISNATRQSVQDATRVSVAAGIAPEEALNIAITDVLEVKLKTHAKRFGPEKTRKLMGFLRQAASADEGALGSIAATRLLSENPEIIQALGQVGLGPDDLARAFEGELASVPRRAVAAQTAERAAEKEAFRKLSAIDSLGPSPAAATPGGTGALGAAGDVVPTRVGAAARPTAKEVAATAAHAKVAALGPVPGIVPPAVETAIRRVERSIGPAKAPAGSAPDPAVAGIVSDFIPTARAGEVVAPAVSPTAPAIAGTSEGAASAFATLARQTDETAEVSLRSALSERPATTAPAIPAAETPVDQFIRNLAPPAPSGEAAAAASLDSHIAATVSENLTPQTVERSLLRRFGVEPPAPVASSEATYAAVAEQAGLAPGSISVASFSPPVVDFAAAPSATSLRALGEVAAPQVRISGLDAASGQYREILAPLAGTRPIADAESTSARALHNRLREKAQQRPAAKGPCPETVK